MAIKTSDGGVYTLKHPNPIMRSQEQWDDDDVILYNFTFPDIIGAGSLPTIHHRTQTTQAFEVKMDMPHTEPATHVANPPNEKPDNIIEDNSLIQLMITFLCLPAALNTFQDDLYDEKVVRVAFGNKYKFVGVIINDTDLMMQFWTRVDIPEFSIVYPQLKTKRWWRITTRSPKSGGYIYDCVSSDLNPDFSD